MNNSYSEVYKTPVICKIKENIKKKKDEIH